MTAEVINRGPIVRDGKTAICTIQPIDRDAEVNGHKYQFRHGAGGICMAWVLNDDVAAVMQIRRQCCGGRMNPVFMIANERQVGYWETGR